MKWLRKNRAPWDSVKEHWLGTQEYRCNTNRIHKDTYEKILNDGWPILQSNLGPQLVSESQYKIKMIIS